MVCLTDLILALDIPSKEWALGRKELAKSGNAEDSSMVEFDPVDNLTRGLAAVLAGSILFLALRFLLILEQIFT